MLAQSVQSEKTLRFFEIICIIRDLPRSAHLWEGGRSVGSKGLDN